MIQMVDVTTCSGKKYPSLCTEQILEKRMHNSDIELSKISDYKVDFDHNDLDRDAAVHNAGNVKHDKKCTDFIWKMFVLLFSLSNWSGNCFIL